MLCPELYINDVGKGGTQWIDSMSARKCADTIPLQARAAEAASAEASAQDAAKEMGKRAKELEAESETLRSELARAREVRNSVPKISA